MNTLFLLNFASSFFLCGLIWIIQILHYPFFARLDRENYSDHQQKHMVTISFLVIPVMLIELITSILLVMQPSDFRFEFIAGLILVLIVWASTFLVQMPIHQKLLQGYDKKTIQKLVSTNWIRTIGWTAKSILTLYLAFELGELL
ncbi:MAG: hypothetical protein WEA58_01000 [Balneolaceae bacterium]